MLNFVQLVFNDDCVDIVLPRTDYPFPMPALSSVRANARTECAKFCSIATTVLISFFVQTTPFLCPSSLPPSHHIDVLPGFSASCTNRLRTALHLSAELEFGPAPVVMLGSTGERCSGFVGRFPGPANPQTARLQSPPAVNRRRANQMRC